MSTWGCYFCCVFLIFFSFFFFSFFAMWSVYYFSFLKKILNVFQKKKMTRNPCWYKILFLFLRRFQKWKQNRKKLQRVERGLFFFSFFFFIYTVEERDKLEMDTVEHTASTILVVQMVTKERTLSIPYWSFGCLQATWISVGAVLFFCFIFFCSHMRRVGFASALLP